MLHGIPMGDVFIIRIFISQSKMGGTGTCCTLNMPLGVGACNYNYVNAKKKYILGNMLIDCIVG
jgi:hypothetical protein